ncbi:MAG: ribonuclease P [Candidatus Nezhaarchaeota archaeon]|nr:ribonuclease P [Candidatus Nezhaarchaeota archaeon]
MSSLRWRKVRDLALQRIVRLFEVASEVYHRYPELADRYVELAKRISMRCRARIPRPLRRRFCHNCGSFLVPGVNCRVRLAPRRSPHVVITCLKCNYVHRIPITN